MIHTIITLVLLYAAMRALLRKKPTDPMAGRLIPRGAYQQQAPARAQPATVAAPIKPGHYLKAYWPKDEPMPESWQ